MSSKKIKLGIDASRSCDLFQKTGVELVSDELLKNINSYNPQPTSYDLIYYTPKLISWLPKPLKASHGVGQKILKWPLKYLWTQICLAWELFKNPPDKFFVPVHKIPLLVLFLSFRRKPESSVVGSSKSTGSRIGVRDDRMVELYTIIHDIAFLKSPEIYSAWKNFYLKFDLKLTLKKCTKIFVPTQAVKNDILKYFPKLNSKKIVVIWHGYTPACHSEQTPTKVGGSEESLKYEKSDKANFKGSFANAQDDKLKKKKQILYIGRIEEKKNIKNLIKAFEIFSKKNPDYELVLAGRNVMNLKNENQKIKLTRYVSGEQKEKLLQESEFLVLISKEEGFGFPILEAWDYELPILASDISVLKEVGGDACLFVNPNSVEEIAKGLQMLVIPSSDLSGREDPVDFRKRLIQKGKERLKLFNWRKSAEKYLKEILN